MLRRYSIRSLPQVPHFHWVRDSQQVYSSLHRQLQSQARTAGKRSGTSRQLLDSHNIADTKSSFLFPSRAVLYPFLHPPPPQLLSTLGFTLSASMGTADFYQSHGISIEGVDWIVEDDGTNPQQFLKETRYITCLYLYACIITLNDV